MFVLPIRIAPAARSSATAGASSAGVVTGRRREASQAGRPATSIASLTVKGTPESGPGPRRRRLGARPVEVEPDDRVQARVEALDRRDVTLEHLEGAQRPGGDPGGDLGGVHLQVNPPSTGQRDPGHVPGCVGGEPEHGLADVRGSSASSPGKTVDAPHSRATSWKYACPVSVRKSSIGVWTTVGQTVLTVTPCGASSRASVRVNPTTPCFDAW